MLKRIDLRGKKVDLTDFLPVADLAEESAISAVRAIIDQVKSEGDEALRSLTQEFDGVTLEEIEVEQDSLESAYNSLSSRVVWAFN